MVFRRRGLALDGIGLRALLHDAGERWRTGRRSPAVAEDVGGDDLGSSASRCVARGNVASHAGSHAGPRVGTELWPWLRGSHPGWTLSSLRLRRRLFLGRSGRHLLLDRSAGKVIRADDAANAL